MRILLIGIGKYWKDILLGEAFLMGTTMLAILLTGTLVSESSYRHK